MNHLNHFKKTLKNQPFYWFSLSFLTLIIFLSLIAPLIPIDPNQTNITNMNAAPNWTNFFGTDQLGRDYFMRVLYGGRVSLMVGVLAMLTSTLIGTTVGLVAGFFGGMIDNLLMRIVDVLSSIPWLVLVIVLSALLSPGLLTIIIVIGCFSWMNIARLVRAETLSVKARDYVDYATFLGIKQSKIIWRHILPLVLPILVVAATANISGAIMTESALSFLGMGIQPPVASWGNLLQNGQSALQRAPHMALIPGFLIALTIYSFNALGDLFKAIIQREDA